jgi:hypothetical protein
MNLFWKGSACYRLKCRVQVELEITTRIPIFQDNATMWLTLQTAGQDILFKNSGFKFCECILIEIT